jgi:hypothetical protein
MNSKMNIFYKIIKHIKSWNLIQVNLVLVNVLLLMMLTTANDLDHFVKVFGQLSLSIVTLLQAVYGISNETELGDIDV